MALIAVGGFQHETNSFAPTEAENDGIREQARLHGRSPVCKGFSVRAMRGRTACLHSVCVCDLICR